MPTETATSGALPNLIVIGAMKCGTSSLHRYLDLHPEVAMSAMKEPNFFVADVRWGNWDRGLDWYRRQFDPTAPVRGEASVNYTLPSRIDDVAALIEETLGKPRLIFMVRDPVERSISHYMHARAAGREDGDIETALSDSGSRYVQRSLYATTLRPFAERFGMEGIHVEPQEELLGNREETMARIFAFLGVDPTFSSPEFQRLWEVSAGKDTKFTLAYRLTRRLGGAERWSRLPTRARWLAERAVVGPQRAATDRPGISPELRRRLAHLYRPEVEELRRLTGLSLDRWEL